MDDTWAKNFDARLREAEEGGLRNQLGLESHERECAIRYGHINDTMAGVRRDMRATLAGGIAIGITVLGFLIKLVFFK